MAARPLGYLSLPSPGMPVANIGVQLLERKNREAASSVAVSAPVVLRAKPSAYSLYMKRPIDGCFGSVASCLGAGGLGSDQSRDRWCHLPPGANGQTFEIYKFRSMMPDRRVGDRFYIGPERHKTHKSANDPRHTPFGRFLRSSSLDELPQLVNVIKGDMSLIGPRPKLVSVAARKGFLVHPRHLERPDITGLFQVSSCGLRTGSPTGSTSMWLM